MLPSRFSGGKIFRAVSGKMSAAPEVWKGYPANHAKAIQDVLVEGGRAECRACDSSGLIGICFHLR